MVNFDHVRYRILYSNRNNFTLHSVVNTKFRFISRHYQQIVWYYLQLIWTYINYLFDILKISKSAVLCTMIFVKQSPSWFMLVTIYSCCVFQGRECADC